MILHRLLCFLGRHRRSPNGVKQIDNVYHSKCKYCGKGMYRDHRRVWRLSRNKR